jgi:hypothetical protein
VIGVSRKSPVPGAALREAHYGADAQQRGWTAHSLHLAQRHVPRVRVNGVWRLATHLWETSAVLDRLYFRVQTATHQVFRQYCKLAAREGAASSHLKRQSRRSAAMHGLQHISFDRMPHISDRVSTRMPISSAPAIA